VEARLHLVRTISNYLRKTVSGCNGGAILLRRTKILDCKMELKIIINPPTHCPKNKYPRITPPPCHHLLCLHPPFPQHQYTELSTLFQNLPSSFIVCGDFNAHRPTWGVLSNSSYKTNQRGNIVDQILLTSSDLLLLNTPGTPTHLNSTHGTLSAILT